MAMHNYIAIDYNAEHHGFTVTTDIYNLSGMSHLDKCTSSAPLMGVTTYSFPATCANVIDLMQIVFPLVKSSRATTQYNEATKNELNRLRSLFVAPRVSLDKEHNEVIVRVPIEPYMYRSVFNNFGVATFKGFITPDENRFTTSDTPQGKVYSLPLGAVGAFLAIIEPYKQSDLYAFKVDDNVYALADTNTLPLPYDGTMDSLKGMPLTTLDVIRSNRQSYSARAKDNRSLSDKLHSMGIEDLYDLLLTKPLHYIDRSQPDDIRDSMAGEEVTVVARITRIEDKTSRMTVFHIHDENGVDISCPCFNMKWISRKYSVGDEVVVSGVYSTFATYTGREIPQITQPIIERLEDVAYTPIISVYKSSQKYGVSSAVIARATRELVDRLGAHFSAMAWADKAVTLAPADIFDPTTTSTCDDDEPQSAVEYIHSQLQNTDTDNDSVYTQRLSFSQALKSLHAPQDSKDIDSITPIISYVELIQLLAIIESQKKDINSAQGMSNKGDNSLTRAYVESLPYDLTGAQKRVFNAIRKGMSSEDNYNALLIGDVGSGKTTIMHLCALQAVEAGHQAVVIAPTEILATQLYDTFDKVISSLPDTVTSRVKYVLHTTYKGKGSAQRKRDTLKGIGDGSINIVFGTTSLLNIAYHDLGFVGVDEQHKFGAEQRSRLLTIREDGKAPDFVQQTATPIPRSLAQIYYGDLEYLHLDELPRGRQPIVTKWIKTTGSSFLNHASTYSDVFNDMKAEAEAGHGIFVVCPMVDSSKSKQKASVQSTVTLLRGLLPTLTMDTVYGGQKKDEQDNIITRFKNGEISVLVASSVVEVGVSCEKATRMIILDANCFGVASLHQIRGRVGRSNLPSVCYLVGAGFTRNAQSRLQSMVESQDGWKLSQSDLKTRGMGSLFDEKQSGKGDLTFANLLRDSAMIDPARTTAQELLHDPATHDGVLQGAYVWFGLTDEDSDTRILK